MGHQTLVEGEWFQILAAHQRETLVGVGMANAGEPLFGDFIEEEGGGATGGRLWCEMENTIGGGKYCWEVGDARSKKRWGLGNGNYKGEVVYYKGEAVHDKVVGQL